MENEHVKPAEKPEEKTERPFAKSEVMQELLQMMQKITAEPNNNAHPRFGALAPEPGESRGAEVTPEVEAEEPTLETELTDDQLPALVPTTQLVESDSTGTILPAEPEDVVTENQDQQPPAKDGFIKRWFGKVVSWVKRLIGF